MKNKFVYKAASMLLLLALLGSCGKQVTTTAPTNDNTPDDNNQGNGGITLNRTPTPVLDPEDIPIFVDKPRPNPPSDQPESPDIPVIRGEGEALEGYTQLLQYIDRSKITAPAGWGSHPVGDIFDGIFETTDEGSNKYGHNEGVPFEITWKMVKSVSLSAYTLYTANDTASYPDRNPKSWSIYGSEDGKEWTLLEKVENGELPAENYASKTFTMKNTDAYRYYKWEIHESEGGSFQLSELLLYTAEDIPETPPVLPPVGVGEFEGTLPAQGLSNAGKEAQPLVGEDAIAWMNDHNFLNANTNILSAYISVSCWADQEGPAQLFDGNFNPTFSLGDMEATSGGKLGCGIPQGAYMVVQTEDAIAPNAYAFVTGNDTATYPERNPVQWVLYGSTDGENWVALDQVKAGNMVGDNFEPHVYTMENTKAYNWFCLSVENTGSLQLNEFMLFN